MEPSMITESIGAARRYRSAFVDFLNNKIKADGIFDAAGVHDMHSLLFGVGLVMSIIVKDDDFESLEKRIMEND